MSFARAREIASATQVLEDAARAAGERVDVLDRALYWQARLAVFPRLDVLTPTDAVAAKTDGTRQLVALATSRPASFYGHLARLLVTDTLGQRAQLDASFAMPTKIRALATGASVTPSAALDADPRVQLARAFVDGGYDDEALVLLSAVQPTADKPDDLVAVALLLNRAGAPGAGHALLRFRGRALMPGRPGEGTALAWSVNWPRAYEPAIVPAATSHAVPPALLFGIAREESAFDADVVSWAGAVGLCQLMPPTAKDEARDEGLPPPDVDSLREASLNARLGAAHIGRRLKGMRHPLLAIAAYNAGPGSVMQWSPRGPLDAWVEQIPVDETRGYVKKVTGSWVTYSMLDGSVDDVRFDLVLK
jgi:soluble lytic murein transglycosylase